MIPPDLTARTEACNCEEWAAKIQSWTWKNGKALTTFTCPVHGTITFDNRELPAPVVRETPEDEE